VVNGRSPSEKGDVRAWDNDLRLPEGKFKVINGNLFNCRTVENFRLHEDDWVGISNRSQKQSLCLNWRARDDNLTKDDFVDCMVGVTMHTFNPAAPMKNPSGDCE